jgi:glutamate-1-semialdehyde 2,1-aminomutase
MFGLFFSKEQQISNFDQVMACNKERFNKFFHGMLEKGIYLAPSAFEAGFVSGAHTEQDIETTIQIADEVLKSL